MKKDISTMSFDELIETGTDFFTVYGSMMDPNFFNGETLFGLADEDLADIIALDDIDE